MANASNSPVLIPEALFLPIELSRAMEMVTETNRQVFQAMETFEEIDIFKDYHKVEDYIKSNKIDMLVVDCEHSKRMAKLIDKKLLPLLHYDKPIFFHDWHDYGKKTYAEQVYYFNHLLDKYNVAYMTDLPKKYIENLKRLNTQLDNEDSYKKLKLKVGRHNPVTRCSAILTPK